MSGWLLVRQRKVRVNKTPEDINSLFEFSDKIESRGRKDRYTDSTEGILFDWRYEWAVQPREGVYEITEKAYITRGWFFMSSFFLIGCLFSLPVISLIESILVLVPLAVSLIFLLFYLFSIRLIIHRETPLIDFIKEQPDQIGVVPYLSFLIVMMIISIMAVPIAFWEGYQYLPGVAASTLIVVYFVFQEQIEQFSIKWQEIFFKSVNKIPTIVFSYTYSLVMISLPALIFVFSLKTALFRDLFDSMPNFIAITYAVNILFNLSMISSRFVDDATYSRARHRQYGSDVSSNLVLSITAAVTVFVSLGFGYLSIRVFSSFDLINSISPGFPTRLIIGSSVIPFLILISGFVYQVWSIFSGIISIRQEIQQQDLGEDYQPSVSTYMLETDGYFAGSVFLGWEEAIVVSEGLAEELSNEELDAIIAHEDSHVVKHEAKMTVLIALLSPLILVGKNVTYVWLNFRSREYRADQVTWCGVRLGRECVTEFLLFVGASDKPVGEVVWLKRV
jgi:Zn-dependent protease with chaperone function